MRKKRGKCVSKEASCPGMELSQEPMARNLRPVGSCWLADVVRGLQGEIDEGTCNVRSGGGRSLESDLSGPRSELPSSRVIHGKTLRLCRWKC